jgi:putative endopeptidase
MKQLFIALTIVCLFSYSVFSQNSGNNNSGYKAIDTKELDNTINPGDDFFAYVNSKWIAANPIPPSESRYGSFNILIDSNRAVLHRILEKDAANNDATKGSIAQKVGDFFASGMDTVDINAAGYKPIQPWLDSINDIKNTNDLIRVVAEIHIYGGDEIFNFGVTQDAKNSDKEEADVEQGGLGLPSRDYYLRKDAGTIQIRSKYIEHIKTFLSLTGTPNKKTKKIAAKILAIETQLAASSLDRVTLRDPYASYHPMPLVQLEKLTPNINWSIYFATIKGPQIDTINVGEPEFFKQVNTMLKSVKLNDWKTYLRFHIINGVASYLSSDFATEQFSFYSQTLNGVKQQQPRWKRVLSVIDQNIGEALGQEYVKVAFPPDAKAKALDLISNLKASLAERINQLDWMSDATKQYALKKLSAITVKVGYPDTWRDYSSLTIDRGPYVLNVMRSGQFEFYRELNKIGKPVDRTEWGMTPPTVNAYYNPANNEIVFPAGILQPPFFSPLADDAVNYGGIGAVIGHEITHGFDDQGRLYDLHGNLKNWWTKQDSANFKQHAELLAKQYSGYSPVDTMHINGHFTLGENIADLGGITISYFAFKRAQEKNPADNENIDGLTPDQRFFISFAQIWRANIRDAAQRQRLLTDPHSPAKYRVDGVVTNVPMFAQAFNVKDGQKMKNPDGLLVKIW